MKSDTPQRTSSMSAGTILSVLSLAFLFTGGLLFFFPQIAVVFVGGAVLFALIGAIINIVLLTRGGRTRTQKALDITGLVMSAFVILVVAWIASMVIPYFFN
jgi:hypothetical protein